MCPQERFMMSSQPSGENMSATTRKNWFVAQLKPQGLALQLQFCRTSESMGYHDSDEVMDDWIVDREHA